MSRAVDTNVVLRYLTHDDPVQAATATEILRAGFVLPVTVLMESEWVLRSFYRWPRDRIAAALLDLIDLPSAIQVPEASRWALGRFVQGADLADMLHLTAASGGSSFATFDAAILADAGADAPIMVEVLG